MNQDAATRAWLVELDEFLDRPTLMVLKMEVVDGAIASTMQNVENGIALRVRSKIGGDAYVVLSAENGEQLSRFLSQCVGRLEIERKSKLS